MSDLAEAHSICPDACSPGATGGAVTCRTNKSSLILSPKMTP
jgi:hypothetical protein